MEHALKVFEQRWPGSRAMLEEPAPLWHAHKDKLSGMEIAGLKVIQVCIELQRSLGSDINPLGLPRNHLLICSPPELLAMALQAQPLPIAEADGRHAPLRLLLAADLMLHWPSQDPTMAEVLQAMELLEALAVHSWNKARRWGKRQRRWEDKIAWANQAIGPGIATNWEHDIVGALSQHQPSDGPIRAQNNSDYMKYLQGVRAQDMMNSLWGAAIKGGSYASVEEAGCENGTEMHEIWRVAPHPHESGASLVSVVERSWEFSPEERKASHLWVISQPLEEAEEGIEKMRQKLERRKRR